MFETGHLAGGYLVMRQLIQQWQLPAKEVRKLFALGALASVLPDVDVLWPLLKGESLQAAAQFDHHQLMTHTFAPYLFLGAAGYLAAGRLDSRKWQRRILVFTAGTSIHLLLDMIGSGTGLMWAWPFSRRMDGFWVLNVSGSAWREVYRNHPVYWIERTLILVAVLVLVCDVWGWVRKR